MFTPLSIPYIIIWIHYKLPLKTLSIIKVWIRARWESGIEASQKRKGRRPNILRAECSGGKQALTFEKALKLYNHSGRRIFE